jgi:hypothetical protein
MGSMFRAPHHALAISVNITGHVSHGPATRTLADTPPFALGRCEITRPATRNMTPFAVS